MSSPDIEDLKYARFGHIDLGRPCDEVVKAAKFVCPGDGVLPDRWAYTDKETFIAKYGSGVLWAVTANYHMLIVKGERLLRIWTNTKGSRGTLMTFNAGAEPPIMSWLHSFGMRFVVVPEGSRAKNRPMAFQTKIKSPEQIIKLMTSLGAYYGMDFKRL